MNGLAYPVITAWSAASPFGMGREAFVEGVSTRRTAVTELDRERWGTPPDERAGLIVGFEQREVLGKKGTRGMNRVSGLAVTTVRRLQEEIAADGTTALVLGTTTGSAETMMETIRTALTAELPFRTDPATTPYGVMNGAAGQCAIWHGFKGPNATIASGRPTGLAALGYARRLLLTGRARTVLFGAAEEYSRARSWLEFHARESGASATVLGEGCAMFSLTTRPSADTPILAEVLALDFRVCVDGDWGGVVDRSVRRALAAAGRSAADVWATCASGAAGAAGKAELAALNEAVSADVDLPFVTELIGETHACSAAFQLAAVLSLAERDPGAAGRLAVITSIDPPSGTAAAAVLRLGDPR
ncbi:beta-ketoacyl synthase N-terminal-like domain-containing protein [Streptosporangium sp. NPDC001559]|uniref:beta-ketoacyl synthase N-terminal-like domain-containing protein n=1 Tax=Streptosporangium sp. NPDC001559 TaxID=3366187 RepID=UPI0036EB4DE6